MPDNYQKIYREIASKNFAESKDTAVALSYDGVNAPVVSALGSGDVASAIVALAQKYDIPIYENPELVEMLSMLELEDEIPHELYVIIAQIIALAYNIKQENTEQND